MQGWYTIVPDWLVAEVGLTSAAVYGVICRYSKGEDYVCHEVLRVLMLPLGISLSATFTSIKKLIEAGYVTDVTPEGQQRRVYRIAGGYDG